MTFSEKLNEYIAKLSCPAKELYTLSEISASTFSRYRNGERIPEPSSQGFEKLCAAIAETAKKRNLLNITAESVKEDFFSCEDILTTDKEIFRRNFNTMITVLNINLTRMCKHINYDISTVFRIRNGTRNPANSEQFADAVAVFTAKEIKTQSGLMALSKLIGCEDDLTDLSVRCEKLKYWLLNEQKSDSGNDDIACFLTKLNDFDLNEYIKAIHFDELKVPTVPFQIPSSKSYFGLKEMMESELDFLKATVLSKSTEPVTMYSDMPMGEMAKDPEFPKKWMYGMALMLKKGLHLNQIHNLDRSFEDMMLGLESWIPMYMTGQISPYYLKNIQNNVFLHFLKVSGAAALTGEAIAGYHSDGKYYLTKSKKEIEYYTKRANELLDCAYPLMEIYRSERENELNAFLLADTAKSGVRKNIFSSLPLYTVSEELLDAVLTANKIPENDRKVIREYAVLKKRRAELILENGFIEDEIAAVSREEFDIRPLSLDISGVFYEKDIVYSYEQYLEHLEITEEFAAEHRNYKLKKIHSPAFGNLQITVHEQQWAMVSKSKAPAIHFVIKHPKLLNAIENFVPPVVE